MKLLIITLLLTLTACSLPDPNIDSDLKRYIDKEMGVVCYTVDKHSGVSCLQSSKLQMEQVITEPFFITPDKAK